MKTSTIGVAAPIVILLIIFVPIVTMWCVDVLFGTNIPLNLKTWFATFVLLAILKSTASAPSKGDQ